MSQEHQVELPSRYASAAALFLGAALLPLIPWLAETPLAGSTYGKDAQLFELFGLTAGFAVLALAVASLKGSAGRPLETRVLALVPLALALYWVGLVTELGWFRGDWWTTYQRGAAAIGAGRPLYSLETTYIFYPPFIAETLLTVQRAVLLSLRWLTGVSDPDRAWWVTFYLFQTLQVPLVVGAYELLRRLARGAGARSPIAELGVAVVLVINNPLLRAVRWGQVNLWILDLTLLALMCARRSPPLAGIALALAINIKVYPVLVFVPLLVMGLWRPLVWTAVGAGGIAGAELLGFGTAHFRQFVDFIPSWPEVVPFRSNSVVGLLTNTLGFVFGLHGSPLATVTRIAVLIATPLALGWFVVRAVQRERVSREGAAAHPAAADRLAGLRLLGHAADALAFGLLLSPLAWEHHFVFAIPLVVLAAVAEGVRRPGVVLVTALLVIGFPTFDAFPFSYVRIAGLLTLIVTSSPSAVAAAGGSGDDDPRLAAAG